MFRLDLPPDMPSGLAAQSTYDHPLHDPSERDRSDLGIFYPFVGHAWHIAVVEVDVETGKLSFLRYAAVHDAGTIVNPKTLDGQVIGGTVQGLGTALYEEYLYDDEGRVRNEQFEYYHLPSSMDVPTMTVGHQETPSPYTPYGIKGAGEGGRMLTPAILSAAIEDALSPYGVTVTSLPILGRADRGVGSLCDGMSEAETLFGDEHVRRYRETGGEVGHIWRNGSKILLLTTKGRNTGEPTTTPLIYEDADGDYVIVASKGGAPKHPGWYRNLAKDPQVEVQVMGDVFPAHARTATGDERERLWRLAALQWPAYDDYAKKTDREIPVVVLEV